MKKLWLLLLCSCSIAAMAQKVDLDRYHYLLKFRNLPHKPLGKNVLTYSFTFTAPASVSSILMPDQLGDAAGIQGFTHIPDNGAVLLFFSASDLSFKDVNIDEHDDQTKDKNGVVTHHYSYTVSAPYSITCQGKALDTANKVIYNNTILGTSTTWTSEAKASRREASEYWRDNAANIKNSLITSSVNNAAATMGRELSYNFGYAMTSSYEHLWILASSKHPEYAAQQAALATVKDAVAKMQPDNLDSFYTQVKPVIDYFDSVKVKYAGKDKSDKKMRYGSFFNNALLYMYLDMPDKAMAEADGLIANDYDKSDGEDLKKTALELQTLLKTNQVTTRHFKLANSQI